MSLPFKNIHARDVRENFEALEKRTTTRAFEAYLATSVTNCYANGIFTKLPLDTLVNDSSAGGASLANDNFVVPRGLDGWWLFSGLANTVESVPDTATVALALFVNGVERKRLQTWNMGALQQPSMGGSVPLRIEIGDAVDVRFYQASGSAKSANGGRALTYFHGVRLG